MRFLGFKFGYAAALVLGFSAHLVHGEILKLTTQQFDDMVTSKFWELLKTSESLQRLINLVTQFATFGPGAVGTTRYPTFETRIASAVTGITAAGRVTASSAPQSRIDADTLADLVRGLPNLRATLLRDIWGARDGQPYSQDLWPRIKELTDYVTQSGNVNLLSASSLLLWMYDGYFDPVVGIYVLDEDKKFQLEIAVGYLRGIFENVQINALGMEQAYLQSIQAVQSTAVRNASANLLNRKLDLVLDFIRAYQKAFKDLHTRLSDLDDPNNPRSLASIIGGIRPPAGGFTTVSVTFGQFGP
ncbi:hypothetical protein TWF281_003174 [Arthrobotrys megalospora]